MKIYLLDSIPGSGKSSWVLNKFKEWNDNHTYDQFVYISPLLTEVGGERIGNKYIDGRVQQVLPEMNFKYPVPIKGSKREHIKQLVMEGKNISCTHSLFTSIDADTRKLLEDRKNVLVIDESLSAIEHYKGVSRQTVKNMLDSGEIEVNPNTSRISWNHKKFPCTLPDGEEDDAFEFKEFVELCDLGYTYLCPVKDKDTGETKWSEVLLWQYPIDTLAAFDDIYVLTYMFQGSTMSSWCKIHDIEVIRLQEKLYRTTKQVKEFLKENVEVIDSPSLQELSGYSLSQTWWQKSSSVRRKDGMLYIDHVKKVLESTVKNKLSPKGLKVSDILVTCPKERWEDDGEAKPKRKVRGKGYSNATWVYSGCRATNQYADKRVIFYLVDKHQNRRVKEYCDNKGVPVDPDIYACSEFLQLIFRGCIRKGEKMYIVVPSKRMVRLYNAWLNSEEVFTDV